MAGGYLGVRGAKMNDSDDSERIVVAENTDSDRCKNTFRVLGWPHEPRR